MKQRILQVITSLLLIMTLTMANFLLLCVDVVSFAADEINADKNTNHKNVEFMAYFKDEKGNKITETDTYANSNDLKLYFQISVKQEGYFNGNIVYINVLCNMSVDCDCCAVAEDPCLKDIGILASLDPVAIDEASINLVKNSNDPGKEHFMERVNSRNGLHTIEEAEKHGIGSREYELVNID